MSAASHPAKSRDDRLFLSWERGDRLLPAMLAASVALHLAAMAIMPSATRVTAPARPVLEVMLEQPPVPLPASAPAFEERALQRQIANPRTADPRRVTAIAEAPPKPLLRENVLTVPEPATTTPPPFNIATPPAEPAPVAEASPKAAGGASAPSPPSGEATPMVPPSFSAAYLRNPQPRYPLAARRSGVEGTVRLKVLVTKEGRAAHVEIDRSSGSSTLDGAAMEAVRAWQFVPARRGQESIESWVLVPVVFKLESTG